MYCTRPTRSPPGPNRAENTSTIFITISLGVAGRIWVVWAWYYGPEPNWPMLSPRSFGGVDKSYPKSAFSLLTDQSCDRPETHRKTRGRVADLSRAYGIIHSLLCLCMCIHYWRKEGHVFKEEKTPPFHTFRHILLFVQRNEVLFKETRPEKFCAALALAACLKFKWKFE